jgi:TctA family transporter
LFLASYVSTCAFQDIVVFLAFGGLGYLMKLFGWPRPPLIVGFILGEIIELNLVTSVALMGWRWLTRPAVLIIISLIIATLLYESVLRRREKKNMPY